MTPAPGGEGGAGGAPRGGEGGAGGVPGRRKGATGGVGGSPRGVRSVRREDTRDEELGFGAGGGWSPARVREEEGA